MGRGSDERMNVERTTDRAMIDGVTYFFFFLTVMVDGNYLWISRIDIVYRASKLYLLVLIFWRIGFRCRRFHRIESFSSIPRYYRVQEKENRLIL